MQIINSPSVPVIKAADIAYGECCTVPEYNNNILLMRIRTHQKEVDIVCKDTTKPTTKLMNLSTGRIFCVAPFTPVIPVQAAVTVL